MSKCIWCDKNIESVYEWTKQGEPLCAKCAEKYDLGIRQGMIKEDMEVKELSKDQKRAISNRLHKIKCFVQTIRYIGEEELVGKMQVYSVASAWVIGIIFFVLIGLVSGYLMPFSFGEVGKELEGGFFSLLRFICSIGLIMAFVFLTCVGVWLDDKVKWILKFHQLKKQVLSKGYWLNIWCSDSDKPSSKNADL